GFMSTRSPEILSTNIRRCHLSSWSPRKSPRSTERLQVKAGVARRSMISSRQSRFARDSPAHYDICRAALAIGAVVNNRLEIELARRLNRNVARLRPAQNLVDILGGTPK